jgi:hypothetical protein
MAIAPPQTLADLTPDWLTQMLRDAGSLRRARVVARDCQVLGAAVGFLDGLARPRLRYDHDEAGAPASVIVKLPATDAAFRQAGDALHAYQREILFYRHVAPRAPLRLARCYYNPPARPPGGLPPGAGEPGPADAGDQMAGLSPAQVEAAVRTIARFHARWREAPELHALDWMPANNGDFAARYCQTWSHFVGQVGALLSRPALELGHRVSEHFELLQDRLAQPSHTICHGDCRADNLLFDDLAGPDPVVVLDWQLAIRGKGIFDVARLIAGSLRPEDRVKVERDLLGLWHRALLASGVRGYPFEQALGDYQAAVLYGTVNPVLFHDLGASAGPRSVALMAAMAERFLATIVELDAGSVLPD